MIRHAVPVMIERGKGIIVNFSSGWGRSTSPEVAPYCASKWAIEGLSQALAQELPRGLAAMALNPGVINTRMLQTCWGEHASSYEDADNWARNRGTLPAGPENIPEWAAPDAPHKPCFLCSLRESGNFLKKIYLPAWPYCVEFPPRTVRMLCPGDT